MKAVAMEGVLIKRCRSAPADETRIRIVLSGKGFITVSMARS